VDALGRDALDVTDANKVRTKLSVYDYVVHCAALTDTARCEREPDVAFAVNATGTENVARACAEHQIPLIAISTNEVFDGHAPGPYGEDAPPGPLNAYARSKLEGEHLALAAHGRTLIVRTSWVYGSGGNNFVEKVRSAAGSDRALHFVTDEIATPTYAEDLAHGIVELIHLLISGQALRGIMHLTNEGEASRYDWAKAILELASVNATVEPTTTAALRAGGYEGPHKPAYSVLANDRAAALGIRLRHWRAALVAYLDGPP
jgi:dTDP-4-dehydrorhamnose reductase